MSTSFSALLGGDLLLLKPPANFDDVPLDYVVDDFEEVGCIASGCRCMAASPDEELLLLLTGDSTFVLMTSADFDPVIEASFADGQQKESEEFVNVGWGKKETQVRCVMFIFRDGDVELRLSLLRVRSQKQTSSDMDLSLQSMNFNLRFLDASTHL